MKPAEIGQNLARRTFEIVSMDGKCKRRCPNVITLTQHELAGLLATAAEVGAQLLTNIDKAEIELAKKEGK